MTGIAMTTGAAGLTDSEGTKFFTEHEFRVIGIDIDIDNDMREGDVPPVIVGGES